MASGPNWNPDRGTWYVQYWDQGWKRKTVTRKAKGFKIGSPAPTKKPPPEALKEFARLAEVEAESRKRSPDEATLPGLLADFLREHAESYAQPTRNSVETVTAHFLDWCKSRGLEELKQVGSAACSNWLTARSKVAAPSTLSRERAQLARAWSKACELGQMKENPWRKAKLPVRMIPKDRGAWTSAEFDKLIKKCKPWLKDVLVIGTQTGIRISALISLTWNDVEWNKDPNSSLYGRIRIRPEFDKAKRGYRVPISRKCHDVLAARVGKFDTDHVLTGMNGKPIRLRGVVATAILRACKSARLSKPDSPNHHMRRTFGRWAVNGDLTGEKIPIHKVSKWYGHSNIKTTMIYLNEKDDLSDESILGPEDKRN